MKEENEGKQQAEWVISKLRGVKRLEKDKNGKVYSYHTLAQAINEYTNTWLKESFRDEVDLSKNHISSYLGSRKSGNSRKSSLPEGLRLGVIERFILDRTKIGKFLNEKPATSSKEIPLSANALFSYLMEGNSSSEVNAYQLLGTFECANAINRYQIEFNRTDNIKILSVNIVLLELDRTDKSESKQPGFRGWAVISPEDYVYIVTKKDKTGENYYFTILEFNNDAYDNNDLPINQFLAIEGSLPFCSLNSASDIELVKNQISRENLMFFNRLHN